MHAPKPYVARQLHGQRVREASPQGVSQEVGHEKPTG